MPNAALDLADLFDKWKVVPDTTTIAALRAGDGDLEEVQLRTVALYSEVKRSIDALEAQGEPVDDLRIWLPDWWKAVFEPDASWGAGVTQPRPMIDVKAIAALRRLGRYLDKSGFRPFNAAPGSAARSRKGLEDVLALLRSGEVTLDPPTRDYVFELVVAIRTVLDASENEVTFDLVKKINELRGALDDIADRVERQYPDSEAPGKLRAAVRRVMPTVVRGAVAVGFFGSSRLRV